MAYDPIRRATTAIVRHRGEPRPWVVCVHGFCMGYPFMDFMGLHTAKLHRELGLNVALPVLPLHGPRKVTLVSGEPFLSFDMMNTVHGLTQAVWDIRRLVSWIRDQGATSIGLYGVSLGAYVVALLAGIEDGFDAVVAGIPVVDFPALFHEHSPVHIRLRSIEHRILGGAVEDVYRVVSPMSFEPKVARDHRYVYRGLRRPPGHPGAGPHAVGALGQAAHQLVLGEPRGLSVVTPGGGVRGGVVGGVRAQLHAHGRGLNGGADGRARRQVPLLGDRRRPTCTP